MWYKELQMMMAHLDLWITWTLGILVELVLALMEFGSYLALLESLALMESLFSWNPVLLESCSMELLSLEPFDDIRT